MPNDINYNHMPTYLKWMACLIALYLVSIVTWTGCNDKPCADSPRFEITFFNGQKDTLNGLKCNSIYLEKGDIKPYGCAGDCVILSGVRSYKQIK